MIDESAAHLLSTALGRVLIPSTDTPGLDELSASGRDFVLSTELDFGPQLEPVSHDDLRLLDTVLTHPDAPPESISLGLSQLPARVVGIRGDQEGRHVVAVGFERLDNAATRMAVETIIERLGDDVVVYETGRIAPLANHQVASPLQPGCSIAPAQHPDRWGTLGAIVTVDDTARPGLLSNAHVLERGTDPAIMQPGPKAVGRRAVAERHAGQLPSPVALNIMDAAVALLLDDLEHTPHLDGVALSGATPALDVLTGTPAVKVGAASGHTTGVVTSRRARTTVRYGRQRMVFVDQYELAGLPGTPFSIPGDSGSVVCNATTGQPFGLLFAGSREPALTWANSLHGTLHAFRATLL